MIVDKSHFEAVSEEEIEELADVYSSSSYSPSTDDLSDSDSDGSFNRYARNTPNRQKIANSKRVDESSLADSDESSLAGSGESFEGSIRKYLDELRKVKGSSDLKNEFLEFCERFEKNYSPLTPKQWKKIKTLDIEMEDIDDDYDKANNKYLLNRTTPQFTKEEVDMIKENWNCFCEDYGFDPKKDLKVFSYRGKRKYFLPEKQEIMFRRYLSQHLPNRQPMAVYLKFLDIYSGRRSEKFTCEEDELLMIWHEISRGTVRRLCRSVLSRILSRILQRSEYMLKRRLALLLRNPDPSAKDVPIGVCSKNKLARPFRWKNKIRECKEDILNRPDNEYPDWTMNEEAWKEMAEINGQCNVKEIKKTYFRELYPSVRASMKVGSTPFKRHLIYQLSLLEDPTWETVDWKELGKNCFNVGAVRVYSVMRTLTKKYVPNEKWSDLKAALETIKKVAQEREKINPGKLSISSAEFVPTSDSDTDDADIVSPDAKGPRAFSNNDAKNGACPKADSHRTYISVAENLEAVESPKKQIGQRGKIKEKTYKAGKNVTVNKVAQKRGKNKRVRHSVRSVNPGTPRICSAEFLPTSDSDTDDADIVSPDAKGPRAPSNDDAKNGACPKADSHRTYVSVAENLEAVESPKKQIGQRGKTKEKTYKAGKNVTVNKVAQKRGKNRMLRISSAEFVPTSDSDTDDADIVSPDAKGPRAPSNDDAKNGACPKADSHRTYVSVAENLEAVESPKKQIGQREKTKEERYKAGNSMTSNEEAQGSGKSDIGGPNDDAAIATHKKTKRTKLNKNENTDKNGLKGGFQRVGIKAKNLKWVRKKDGEIEESDSNELDIDTESQVVICRKPMKLNSHKKVNLKVEGQRKSNFVEGSDSDESNAEVGTQRKKKHLAHNIDHDDMMNTPQSDEAESQRHAGESIIRYCNGKSAVESPKKRIGQHEKAKKERYEDGYYVTENEEAQGDEKSGIGGPDDSAAVASHLKKKQSKHKNEEGKKTDTQGHKNGRQKKKKKALNLRRVKRKDGKIGESEGEEPATEIESPVVVWGKRKQRNSGKKGNLEVEGLRKSKFIEGSDLEINVGTSRKKKHLAQDVDHDAMNTPQVYDTVRQRRAEHSRIRDSSRKVIVKAQFVTPLRTKSTGGLVTQRFMHLFNCLNNCA